jgi:hypothetical protein
MNKFLERADRWIGVEGNERVLTDLHGVTAINAVHCGAARAEVFADPRQPESSPASTYLLFVLIPDIHHGEKQT